MVRLVLISIVLLASRADAQDAIEAHEQLARAMEAEDWDAALNATRRVIHSPARPTPLRESIECMRAFLLELKLQQNLGELEPGIDALSLRLSTIDATLQELIEAYPQCSTDAPSGISPTGNDARRAALAYVRPRSERAARLAREARESGSVSAELEQVFATEHTEIVAAIVTANPSGPDDPWRIVRLLWSEQRTPDARPREWPLRSEAPIIVTGVLFAGFGLVSFFSTLTALAGTGVPSLSAGGWGITFSLLPAIIAAWTWENPKRGLLITSMALTAIAVGGGAAAIGRLDRDGRYFGRGLLIGSAVSAMWQIGGWVHHGYPDRSRREWQQRVQLSPAAGRGFAGAVAHGRF